MATISAGLAAIVVLVDVLVRWRAHERLAEARTLRWLMPAAIVGIAALGVARAVRGVGERGAVLAYLFFDLRWWWAAIAASAVCWRVWHLAAPATAAPTHVGRTLQVRRHRSVRARNRLARWS